MGEIWEDVYKVSFANFWSSVIFHIYEIYNCGSHEFY